MGETLFGEGRAPFLFPMTGNTHTYACVVAYVWADTMAEEQEEPVADEEEPEEVAVDSSSTTTPPKNPLYTQPPRPDGNPRVEALTEEDLLFLEGRADDAPAVELPADEKRVVPTEGKDGVQEITSGIGAVAIRQGSKKSASKKSPVRDLGRCFVGLSREGWLATVSSAPAGDDDYDYHEARVIQSVPATVGAAWHIAIKNGNYYAYPSHNNMKLHTGAGIPTLTTVARKLD
eukprot:gb/GEZN01014982.1/.p1 GENE.gb/GEZN01014982.1/~~gb/GEZN01014982.1/.p1  ORF type:complete len:232 (+),score=20.19 gb/GEZN01014982.1/:175-870(+)